MQLRSRITDPHQWCAIANRDALAGFSGSALSTIKVSISPSRHGGTGRRSRTRSNGRRCHCARNAKPLSTLRSTASRPLREKPYPPHAKAAKIAKKEHHQTPAQSTPPFTLNASSGTGEEVKTEGHENLGSTQYSNTPALQPSSENEIMARGAGRIVAAQQGRWCW
jgi:hypothetical protein